MGMVTVEKREALKERVTEEETLQKSSRRQGAGSGNGFPLVLFQRGWGFLKDDVMCVMKEFLEVTPLSLPLSRRSTKAGRF